MLWEVKRFGLKHSYHANSRRWKKNNTNMTLVKKYACCISVTCADIPS